MLGVLFSIPFGVALVLSCGVFTAVVAFLIGRQFRGRILAWLATRPAVEEKFRFMDNVIAKVRAINNQNKLCFKAFHLLHIYIFFNDI